MKLGNNYMSFIGMGANLLPFAHEYPFLNFEKTQRLIDFHAMKGKLLKNLMHRAP